jgi:nucleoprotein TPR
LDQRTEEHEQVIRNLKAQYDARIQRFEKEINEHASEKSELMQRFNQMQRQIGAGQSSKPATSTMEKGTTDASSRTANVKPMAGPSQQSATVQPWRGSGPSGETPLASIRPISVQNSRTAAVMPTTNVQSIQGSTSSASVTALVPPQQQVHTTASQPGEVMSSSPTSSHTDYMPATSSAAVVVAITPMGSSQNAAESSSQGQELDLVPPTDSSIQVVTGGQPVAQAVALVSPRVETQQSQIQQNLDNQAPSTSGSSLVRITSSV